VANGSEIVRCAVRGIDKCANNEEIPPILRNTSVIYRGIQMK
jgi:hypothetical protein